MLTYAVRTDASRQVVVLEGVINEAAAPVFAHLTGQSWNSSSLILDLSAIKEMNSIGTRFWLTFLRDISKQVSIEIHRCSVAMVDYANVIPGLFSRAVLKDFFAPFHCPRCGQAKLILISAATAKAHGQFGTVICPSCQGPVTADTDEESYLSFLSHSSIKTLPSA